jgi:hypothetical protein
MQTNNNTRAYACQVKNPAAGPIGRARCQIMTNLVMQDAAFAACRRLSCLSA